MRHAGRGARFCIAPSLCIACSESDVLGDGSRAMPTFIEKCCCRGKRPAGVVGLRHNLRPDVTGALLRDRRVPRFLVAPTGYGKSACAYEYAQVVFGFEGVFWVRCDSPCFIRDLDNGTLAD